MQMRMNKVVDQQLEAAFSHAWRAVGAVSPLHSTFETIRQSTLPRSEKLHALYVRLHTAAIAIEQAKATTCGARAFAILEEKLGGKVTLS